MTPVWSDDHLTLYGGDCREVLATLPDRSVQTVVTSPPYWGLRDYGMADQLGLEPTPEEYVANMVAVFREVWRVLRDDGTLWLNLGDSYTTSSSSDQQRHWDGREKNLAMQPGRLTTERTGLKQKDLVGIPWRVAFALQADGWYLRSDIIWAKPNPMPESVTDRPTKSHEYVFLLSKAAQYFYDAEAVREPHAEVERPQSEKRRLQRMGREVASVAGRGQSSKGIDGGEVEPSHTMRTNPAGRNRRSVWVIPTQPYPGAHFAVFPSALVEPCIKAGTSAGGGCATCGTPWVRETGISRELGSERPQAVRAMELASAAGLTEAHFDAIRAVGATDVGKARVVQTGTGKNRPEVQRLADEAKTALGGYYREFLTVRRSTTGWSPGCDHDAPSVPQRVLDPFAGSGTTLVVAQSLGRRATGIDLNPDYLRQCLERNAQTPLGLVI